LDLALPGLALGSVDACSGGLEKFAGQSTSEVREFLRVVRGSCVHRVVSASPSRPARPACPMPVDVRTRGGSGAKIMRNQRRNQGRTNWCSGASARWLLVRVQHSPSCMPMRAARYDVAGRVTSSPGARCGARGGEPWCATVRDVPSPSARRRSAVARFHTRTTVTCIDKRTSI
jgi:hypothetical protein